MNCKLKCTCGTVQGTLDLTGGVNRVICYCRDCQAFAHYLDRAASYLNEHGGSDIVQTSPYRLTFTAGMEQLRSVRLKPDGMLRWYTGCCKTPVGNTLPNYKWSFIGMTRPIFAAEEGDEFDALIGQVGKHVNTESATGELNVKPSHPIRGFINILAKMLLLRLNRRYRDTPFFDEGGLPLAELHVLTDNERRSLYKLVAGKT
jgi:Family of unknown function (DUF6151)